MTSEFCTKDALRYAGLHVAAFILSHSQIRGGGVSGHRPAPWNFGKNVVIGMVNGVGLILHSIYVEYNPDYMCAWCRLELISVFSLILILECAQGNNEKLERKVVYM